MYPPREDDYCGGAATNWGTSVVSVKSRGKLLPYESLLVMTIQVPLT